MQLDTTLKTTNFNGLEVTKWIQKPNFEVLMITLEKDHTFPEHISPKDAVLIVLDGTINFKIKQRKLTIQTNESFQFKADEPHEVDALTDSKFLIIR
jgi:quercetin dioxygenase-like cupin family protein